MPSELLWLDLLIGYPYYQGSFYVNAQPVRDDVTMQRRLSLAGRIHQMISVLLSSLSSHHSSSEDRVPVDFIWPWFDQIVGYPFNNSINDRQRTYPFFFVTVWLWWWWSLWTEFQWWACTWVLSSFRILAQFAFTLSQDWELPSKKDLSRPLKDGVRDMLVKHHLFSWDI